LIPPLGEVHYEDQIRVIHRIVHTNGRRVRMSSAVKTEQLGRVFRLKKREGKSSRGKAPRKEVVALSEVDLEVGRGELFGLLGPNGAGKTTLIKILNTLLAPTSGEAWVAGVDVSQNPSEVRRHIGVVSGGETSGYGLLTVEENLWMFTQFYGLPSRLAKQRVAELLDVVGLADRAKTKIYHLSTGLRQKMNFARGFLTDPEILFLDEPTLGLDVQTSRHLRGFVRRWMQEHPDKTILLTTHYMQEADELCNRVAIIDQGRILTCDRPVALKRALSGSSAVCLQLAGISDPAGLAEGLRSLGSLSVHEVDGYVEVDLVLERDGAIQQALGVIGGHGGEVVAMQKRDPTLEDVFVSLVGRGLNEETR